ncbi:PglL family O-oligosaccharyltransferase [Pantoea ananatis]|uniref:PglL family O-oligosaccharyltransferase n=1 Tax=Pantoea ananas TaxID=553 RepID=UPI001B308321|nr:O-antigen ligase family protein [Pantoea ananatis]
MQEKSKDWLFRLLAFYLIVAMHIYWPNRGGSGFYLPWNMVGMILLAIITLMTMKMARAPLARSRFFKHLISGSVILLLPLLWTRAPYLGEALPRFIGLLMWGAAYFSLLQYRLNRQWRHRLLVLLLAATAIEACWAALQYFWTMPDQTIPYGIFQQVNMLASFMACGLALALYLYCCSTTCRLQWLISFMLLLAPFLLLISFSRIGLLAFILLTPWQLAILYRVSRRRCILATFLIFGGVLAALLMLDIKGAPRAITTLSTVSYRLNGWQEAWVMLWEKPILGWGYGSFQYQFLHHIHQTHPDLLQSFNLSHPHNELLFWAVEGGLLSLFGIALLGLGLWRLLRRRLLLPRQPTPWIVILPIALHMMVEYPLYLSAAHAIFLLVILRVCDVRQGYRQTARTQQFTRITVGGLSLLTLLYMVNGLYSALIITAVEKQGLKPFSDIQLVIMPTPWQTRYDFDTHLYQLLKYPKSKDFTALLTYKQWAESEIRVRPEANIYFNLILVNRLLQQSQQATLLQLEAQRLFPEDMRFREE